MTNTMPTTAMTQHMAPDPTLKTVRFTAHGLLLESNPNATREPTLEPTPDTAFELILESTPITDHEAISGSTPDTTREMTPERLSDSLPQRRRGDRGEGVISAAIAVLIIAFLGAAMWVGFNSVWKGAEKNINTQVDKIGSTTSAG